MNEVFWCGVALVGLVGFLTLAAAGRNLLAALLAAIFGNAILQWFQNYLPGDISGKIPNMFTDSGSMSGDFVFGLAFGLFMLTTLFWASRR